MDPAIAQVFVQIRDALALDCGEQVDAGAGKRSEILPAIRDALEKDEALSGADDRALAGRVSELLPSLLSKLRQTHLDASKRLSQDFPWTLLPLDWDMDLLGSLSKSRSETTHTQCLAYLLDSRGSHGLGTRVLRELFRLLGRLIPGDDVFARLTNSDGDLEHLPHVRVIAEHCVEAPTSGKGAIEDRRCDLWVELVEEGRSLVVVIENKIDAGEHNEQLAAYEQAVWKWARDNRCNSFEQRLVFLTPDGRAPTGTDDHRAWLPMSYKQLSAALAHAARDAPEPGRTFLLLYVSTLLKSIIGIAAKDDDVAFIRRLLYMNEVIAQGGSRG